MEEELEELKEAVAANDQDEMTKEFGDVLFSLVNYARFIEVDPENALATTNQKFINRFQKMEAEAAKQGKLLLDMTLREMDALWNEVKKEVG